jgi:hypothetical protein
MLRVPGTQSWKYLPTRMHGALRVDLVVLSTCFAMLAVVAVPRHLSISSEARLADASHLALSVESAVSLAHSVWEAQSGPSTLNLPRGRVRMVNGYPSATTVQLILDDAETADFEFHAGRWQHRDLGPGRTCGVAYEPPAAPALLPKIETLYRGC